jgi:hypothetical protein
MLTRRRKIAAIGLMVASLVGIAAPASAAGPNTPPEVIEMNKLANLTQTEVTEGGESSNLTVTQTVTEGTTAAGCDWRKVSRVATFSLGGGTAWSIFLRGDWCWGSGGNVKSVSWNKDFFVGTQLFNTWQWVKWEGTVTGGGVGTAHVYRRIKGHLKSCFIISFGTICDHAYPFVSMTLRGDGTSSADTGG